MELTQQKINELLDGLMMAAKYQREKIPYSKTDAFPQVLVFLGPELEPCVQPANWRNEQEKYAMMAAVSKVAEMMLCQAVVLITDVRWVEHTKAEKMLGLPSLEEIGVDKWGELYKREVTKRYKGYLGNAPPELYSEAIIAVMKGPGLNQIPIRAASYEKGPNDSIHWLPKTDVGKVAHFNLLPDWWC